MTSKRVARPSLGQRIGLLRAERGWTQADLAARLGLSRVAVSHFEMGLAVPSERTVVLLAGLFKQGPHELVAGTDYPIAKRDRLPLVACRYTEVEFQVELLRHDLDWLGRIHEDSTRKALAAETLVKWESALTKLSEDMIDPTERTLLQDAKRVLCALREESRLSETHAIPVGGD